MVNLEVINDLWLQIDKLHLSCLQTEKSPQRIVLQLGCREIKNT